jgi:membrane protein DedA with SNARE-associated domain
MEILSDQMRALTSSEWVYALLFAIAIAEAVVITSFVISGTIGFVAVGALVAHGLLDPLWSGLAIYLGTLAGDLTSFKLAGMLQRVRFVAAALGRLAPLREPLGRAPMRFIILGHFTPYLRALMPILASGVVPLRTYILIEMIAALLGTIFFMSLGFAGAHAIAEMNFQAVLAAVGAVAGLALLALWIRARRPFCPLRPGRVAMWQNWRRTAWFLIWYLPWQAIRWMECRLRGTPSRRLCRSLAASFPDIRAGDIFVVRLHAPAPWGRWAHSAIAITPTTFAHGFASEVEVHRIEALPVRYAIAHLRVRCDEGTAERAAIHAMACVGTPVAILAGRGETNRFSCASLVGHAYHRAGVELVGTAVARIVPDDLFSSAAVELVRIVHTEKVSKQTRRYVFEARKEG